MLSCVTIIPSHYILSLDVRLEKSFYTISHRVWIKRVKEMIRFFEFFVYKKFAFGSVCIITHRTK